MPRSETMFAFVLILSSITAPELRAAPNDWPQWQGPQRNNANDETGLLSSWPKSGPKLQWLFEECGTGYSGPAIVGDQLYILGGRDNECQVIALNADTGEELWATPIGPEFANDWGDGPRGTPTVDGDRVYALGGDGTLACVRRQDGKLIWRKTMKELGGKIPHWGYTESVLIDGNKVVCTPGGEEGAIAALDKMTGDVVWQAKDLTEGAHYSSIVRAEINGEPQYVQLMEKRVVGIAPDDGRLLWEVGFPGSVAVIPTPIVEGNQVFVTAGYGAGCMLVEIGPNNEAKKVYANKQMKNHHGGVIRIGNYVYGHSDGPGWMCLDVAAGDPKWRERKAFGKGAIGYADGKFYCVDEEEGEVVLIDASPEGWEEHGRFKLAPQSSIRKPRGKIWVHPVIVNGRLFLRDQEYLYCFDVKS